MQEKEVLAKVRRLYPAQEFSWDSVLIPDNQAKLQSKYSFAEFGLVTEARTAALRGARGQYGGEPIRAFTELRVEPQALEVTVQGLTPVAEIVLEEIEQLLISFAPSKLQSPLRRLIQSYETFCVCNLDFDWMRIFSSEYSDFIHRAQSKIEGNYHDTGVALWPSEIRFSVVFTPNVPDFRISNKMLAIEPRKGAKTDDRLYWSSSPLPSDRHIELLKELEGSLRRETTKPDSPKYRSGVEPRATGRKFRLDDE